MGGRGNSSTFSKNKGSGLSKKEIDDFTNQSMHFIKNLPPRINPIGTREDFGEMSEPEVRKKVKSIYEKGFSGLDDGTILGHVPKNKRYYVVKQGNNAVMYHFKPTTLQSALHIKNGKVVDERGEKVKEIKLDNEKRKKNLKYVASRWFLSYSV